MRMRSDNTAKAEEVANRTLDDATRKWHDHMQNEFESDFRNHGTTITMLHHGKTHKFIILQPKH